MVDARQANISQSAAAARHCMYNMCPEMNSYLMQAGGSAQPHHSKKLGGAGGGGERQHWRGSLARSFARQRRNEGRNEGRKEGRKEGRRKRRLAPGQGLLLQGEDTDTH
jgi:hypothetical protein